MPDPCKCSLLWQGPDADGALPVMQYFHSTTDIWLFKGLLIYSFVFILVHQYIDKEVRERSFHAVRSVGEENEGRRE